MQYERLRDLVAQRLPAINIKDPEAVARAVHAACIEFAKEVGHNPETEVDFVEPGAQKHIPAANGWTVVYEAGPFDWGVVLSFFLLEQGARLCEPSYGFDLTFYRDE